MNTRAKIIACTAAAFVFVAAISFLVSWYRGEHPPISSKAEYVTVPEISAAVKIKRISVPVEKVITIEKTAIVEKLELPEEIAKDENSQITATGEITPYEGKTNVVSIIDTKSGESLIVAKQAPLSFIDFVSKKEIGVRYGYRSESSAMSLGADVYGRWDFLRVGNIHVGVYGEVGTSGNGKAMISAGYRW